MRFLKIFILSVFFLSFFSASFSCKKEANFVNNLEQSIALDQESLWMIIGETKEITANVGTGITPNRTYTWTSANPEVASVASTDFSATITAKSKGSTQIRITSTDGVIRAICEIVVEEEGVDDGVIRILAIGNSFSEDAFESYFHALAKADGKSLILGHLAIGGSSLSQHVQNAKNNAPAYSYRKIDVTGNKTTVADYTLSAGIADERWDYISLQQVSNNSGIYSTFESDLPPLINYIKPKAKNRNVKYVLHQTWAYAQNSTHAAFPNYNKDQMTMYTAIVDAVGRAKTLVNADVIVPAGTAIQNARTSYLEDNFTRDGYHLDLNIGRYTASCAWFETIFGKSVVGNTFKPTALSDYQAALAQHAAHFAVLKPNEITELTDYKLPESAGTQLKKPLYIAFGPAAAAAGWNRLSSPQAGTSVLDMKDTDGNLTPVSLTVIERFNAHNTVGAATTTTDFNMPASVSQTNFYGNTKAFGGITVPQSKFKLSGLDKTKKYNLCYFGSRMSVSDNRETAYIASGKNEVTSYLNVSANSSNTVCANGVQPNDDGEIIITVTVGPNNNNSTGFFHITAMRVSPVI